MSLSSSGHVHTSNDPILAENEKENAHTQKKLEYLLRLAIENRQFGIVCSITTDERFQLPLNECHAFLDCWRDMNDDSEKSYLILQAILSTPHLSKDNFERVIHSGVIPKNTLEESAQRLLDQKNKVEWYFNRTQKDKEEIQRQFAHNIGLHMYLYRLIKEPSPLQTIDRNNAERAKGDPDFRPLPALFTQHFRDYLKHPDLLSSIMHYYDISLCATTLNSMEKRSAGIITDLMLNQSSETENEFLTSVLKQITKNPSVKNVLSHACANSSTQFILEANQERIALLDPHWFSPHTLFRYGDVPFLKPTLSFNSRNYETLLSLAIKQKKWGHVAFFMQTRKRNFFTPITQGKNAYRLLEKAAKKDEQAKALFKTMQEKITSRVKAKRRLTDDPGPG